MYKTCKRQDLYQMLCSMWDWLHRTKCILNEYRRKQLLNMIHNHSAYEMPTRRPRNVNKSCPQDTFGTPSRAIRLKLRLPPPPLKNLQDPPYPRSIRKTPHQRHPQPRPPPPIKIPLPKTPLTQDVPYPRRSQSRCSQPRSTPRRPQNLPPLCAQAVLGVRVFLYPPRTRRHRRLLETNTPPPPPLSAPPTRCTASPPCVVSSAPCPACAGRPGVCRARRDTSTPATPWWPSSGRRRRRCPPSWGTWSPHPSCPPDPYAQCDACSLRTSKRVDASKSSHRTPWLSCPGHSHVNVSQNQASIYQLIISLLPSLAVIVVKSVVMTSINLVWQCSARVTYWDAIAVPTTYASWLEDTYGRRTWVSKHFELMLTNANKLQNVEAIFIQTRLATQVSNIE